MAIEGITICAVKGCGGGLLKPGNLCSTHALGGGVVFIGRSSMIVTAWHVQHENQRGVILLNDFALGDLFGGAAGFEKHLKNQGFTNIRNVSTAEEADELQRVKLAAWTGPWQLRYPWEKTAISLQR